MNLSSAAIVLRERGSLEVVDLTFRFVRSVAPLLYVRTGSLFVLPAFLGCLGLRYVLELEWGWVWLAAWVGSTVTQGPFTVLAGHLLFADQVRARTVVLETLRRSITYSLLLGTRALLFVASLVTFIGPFLVWPYTAYLHEIVYLENGTLRSSLGRSRRFVRGRSGASLEMVVLVSCMLVAFVVLAEVIGLALLQFVFQVDVPIETLTDDGGSVFALAGLFLSVPFTSTLRFLSYVNERTLRDGWDVQVRFLGIRDGLEGRS